MDPKAAHYRFLMSKGRYGSVPIEFIRRPSPTAETLSYWNSFWELSSTRQLGMSAGPIPYTALRSYARDTGIDGEDFETFRRLMRAMDTVYLEQIGKRPDLEDDDD